MAMHGRPQPELTTGQHDPTESVRPDAATAREGNGPAGENRGGRHHEARILAALIAAMIAFSVAPIVNCLIGKEFNKDYTLWYQVGGWVLRGQEIYPKDGRPFPFMYPPPAAAMLGVLSTLGYLPLVVILLLVNSAAWAACILLAVGLVTGRAFRQHPLLYLVPTLAVAPYVHDTFLLGQPNLLLLACMLGAFACLRRRYPGGAGVLIAFAAAVKAFPILALGYLVYRRHWRATAVTLVALAAFLIVVPIPFRGPARAWDDLKTWTGGMVLKYDAGSIAQRPERSYSFKNQSLVALANRLLRPIPADGEAKQTWTVNVADLDFRTINAVIAAAGLGLCGFYVAAMPRPARRTARTDAIEFAMLLLLILFFSPLSFNYFFVWLLYPLTVAMELILSAPAGSRSRAARVAWLAATVTVMALPIPFPRVAQACGSEFFAGLILLIGLGCELRRSGRSRPSAVVAPRRPAPRRDAVAAG